MILTARTLTTWQSCHRRAAFEREWMPLRWRPKSLFDVCLRQAVLELSSGKDKDKVSLESAARYLEIAAKPGLDTMVDPYTLAHDHVAMVRNVIESVSRMTLLSVKPGPVVKLSDDAQWQCSAFQDDSGLLHRWATVEKLDDDALARELHSWHVFGDIAAAQVPMSLHIVEIGRQSKGHQHTAWCRAWKHPVVANHFRFQARDGGKLKGDWKQVWFQDSDRNDPKTWVDLMESDGLRLIRHIDVKEPSQQHVEEFRSQVAAEARAMAQARDPFTILMERTSCDVPYPCPFQPACYSRGRVDMAALGGFATANRA